MKCFQCMLHFVAFTDDEVEFLQQEVRCPECGAGERAIWVELELAEGFIYEEMGGGEVSGTIGYLKENPQVVQALRPERTSNPVLARTSRSEFSVWRRPVRYIKKLFKRSRPQ